MLDDWPQRIRQALPLQSEPVDPERMARTRHRGDSRALPPIHQSLKHAAVLIPIVQREQQLRIVLTERALQLRVHAGQVCFPGGRCEAGDGSYVATALREAQEELAIDPASTHILGYLSPYITVTGYCIVPVVAAIHAGKDLVPEQAEVQAVLEPPLLTILNPANMGMQHVQMNGRSVQYRAIEWQGRTIWGATAGMLADLSQQLFNHTLLQ